MTRGGGSAGGGGGRDTELRVDIATLPRLLARQLRSSGGAIVRADHGERTAAAAPHCDRREVVCAAVGGDDVAGVLLLLPAAGTLGVGRGDEAGAVEDG